MLNLQSHSENCQSFQQIINLSTSKNMLTTYSMLRLLNYALLHVINDGLECSAD